MSPLDKLTIQISKTAAGTSSYVQILSGDSFSLNIVLIADEVEITDDRDKSESKG